MKRGTIPMYGKYCKIHRFWYHTMKCPRCYPILYKQPLLRSFDRGIKLMKAKNKI